MSGQAAGQLHSPEVWSGVAPAQAIDRAAAAFGDVVREHSGSEGMPQAALIGIGAR